jgi:hypothetical protein
MNRSHSPRLSLTSRCCLLPALDAPPASPLASWIGPICISSPGSFLPDDASSPGAWLAAESALPPWCRLLAKVPGRHLNRSSLHMRLMVSPFLREGWKGTWPPQVKKCKRGIWKGWSGLEMVCVFNEKSRDPKITAESRGGYLNVHRVGFVSSKQKGVI